MMSEAARQQWWRNREAGGLEPSHFENRGAEPPHISKHSIIILLLYYTIPISEKWVFLDSKLAALQCSIIIIA